MCNAKLLRALSKSIDTMQEAMELPNLPKETKDKLLETIVRADKALSSTL